MRGSALPPGMSHAACDSKKENAEEKQADAVRKSADAIADTMEATVDKKVTDGVDSRAENAQKSKVAAIRDVGDAKADAMENNADKRDKTPEQILLLIQSRPRDVRPRPPCALNKRPVLGMHFNGSNGGFAGYLVLSSE